MRFVVLLFGLVGILLTGVGAVVIILLDDVLRSLVVDYKVTLPVMPYHDPTDISTGNAGIFILIAAFYGFLGVLFAFFRCGKQGAMLILIPVLGAAYMNPFSIPFLSVLFFTGFLALLVGPLPINQSADEDEEDDASIEEVEGDDEPPPPKAKPKPKPKKKIEDDDE